MNAATVTLAATKMIARYPGACAVCDRPVTPGQPIDLWAPTGNGRKLTSHAGCSPSTLPGERRCATCLGRIHQPEGWNRSYTKKHATGPATCPRCATPPAVALTLGGDL